MKKMLVLMAVVMMTANAVGCCCCGDLFRSTWNRGAYCGPCGTAAVTPAMASPCCAPAPYAYSSPMVSAPMVTGCETCCSPCAVAEPSCGMPMSSYGMTPGCVGCDTGYGTGGGEVMVIPGPGME